MPAHFQGAASPEPNYQRPISLRLSGLCRVKKKLLRIESGLWRKTPDHVKGLFLKVPRLAHLRAVPHQLLSQRF